MTADPKPATEQTITAWANGGTRTRIAAHIAREILAGKHRPHVQLPPNHALADDFGASTATVTRAKALLAQHGLLRKENGAYRVT
jgi:DNA-binding GntR family transcriptional regulator